MEIHIDGTTIGTEIQFHDLLSKLLNFGPHYGRNLAALRDRLLSDVERPIKLVWEHSAVSKNQVGGATFDKIIAIFDEAAQQDVDLKFADKFEYELR